MTTPFQTPAWRGAAVQTGRFADATVVVQSAGREVVLPALHRRGAPWAVSSLPKGWGFGGIVVPDGHPTRADVAALVAELPRRGIRAAQLRPPPWQDEAFASSDLGWSRVVTNHSYDIDLEPGWPAVSAGFTSSVRRAVRKAERSGVVVERRTDTGAMAEFHRLYRLSVLRWSEGTRVPRRLMELRGRLAEPAAKYDAVSAQLGDDCGVWLARHEGAVVGAIVVLSHGREHAYWRGAMDLELAGPVRATDLLQASAIEHACDRGARRYAMGLTAPGSGLARFKSGFGADLRVSHEYAIEPPWLAPVRRRTEPLLGSLRSWATDRSGS
jgi:hypothetical protein